MAKRKKSYKSKSKSKSAARGGVARKSGVRGVKGRRARKTPGKR